jgi:hypothetical protein
MKTSFVKVMGYLILFLSILNIIMLMVYGFTGRILLSSIADPGGAHALQTLLTVNAILAAFFVYEFQKPRDTGSWIAFLVAFGFNLFLVLDVMVLDFGAQQAAVYLIVCTITMVIDVLAFFPYQAFQKHEVKPQ